MMKEVFGSMALDDLKGYTFDDIRNLPENVRAELIDGQICYLAHPKTIHQALVTDFVSTINQYIKEHNGDCRVFATPFGVYLDKNTNTFVEPDICVICERSKIDFEGCNGAPDWIIEIVSPSSICMDYVKKLFKYRTAGVREYWIVDPLKSRILVYCFEKDSIDEFSFRDTISSEVLNGLEIDFSKMELLKNI